MEEHYAKKLRCMTLEDAKDLLLQEGSMETPEGLSPFMNPSSSGSIASIDEGSCDMDTPIVGNDLMESNLSAANMRRVQTCPSELNFMNGNVVSQSDPFGSIGSRMPSSGPVLYQLEPLHSNLGHHTELPLPDSQGVDMQGSEMASERMFVPSVAQQSPFSTGFSSENSDRAVLSLTNSSQNMSPPWLSSSSMVDTAMHTSVQDSGGLRRIKSSPVTLSSLTLPPPNAESTPSVSMSRSPSNHVNRLAKKAEAARLSRLRKKAYVQSLEERVAKLTARLAELQTSLDSKIGDVVAPHENEQHALKSRMHQLLELETPPQSELQRVLDEFVAGSRKRQSAVEFFLNQADICVAPMLQVKFAMWGLDSDAEDTPQCPGVWSTVMSEEVGLSDAQMHELKSLRMPVRELRHSLESVQARVQALKESVRAHLMARHRHLDELRSLLTPEQVAKFVRWIDSNPLCMQILQTVL